MHKIKITQDGWAGYTGILGTLEFVNGISTTVPTKVQAAQFGVVMKFAEVDADGNELGQMSANAELVRTKGVAAKVATPMKRASEMPKEVKEPEAAKAPEIKAPNPMPFEKPADPAKVYTAEELEAIADKEGIKGLRKIGTPLGAKNTSIAALIEEILQAQAKAKAK